MSHPDHSARRRRGIPSPALPAYVLTVLAIAASLLALGTSVAQAALRSKDVALVPDRAGQECCAGALPTKGSVHGVPADSFEEFEFTNLPIAGISSTSLAGFDTVVLNQVNTSSLGSSERLALSEFVTDGGKLIIHDADATSGNDYSWLPSPAYTHTSCTNCGSKSGDSKVVVNTTLVSKDPFSPYYANLAELSGVTDAVGDANVMVKDSGTWFKDIAATDTEAGLTDNAIQAYAAAGNGLMLYDGYDTDYIGVAEGPNEVDWLAKLWYQELKQRWHPDYLPRGSEYVVYYPEDAFSFTGFFPPVQNPPRLNKARADQAIPVRFRLGGNRGRDIFATGFPKSRPIACDDPSHALGPATPAISPDGWSLQFSRHSGRYTFQWETNRRWAGSCRQLVVTFADGSTHTARFEFQRRRRS